MNTKRLLTSSIMALAMTAAVPAAANAASATVTGTVTGSALSLTTSAAPSFSANLDSGDSTPTYNAALAVKDTRGTGAGWNATITSTQFTTGTHASSLTGVTNTCSSGTCTNSTNSITYPVAVPAAGTPPTAVKFFSSASNSGMGSFTTTPTIGVFVPQNSYAGSYSSTLTLSIVSGP